MNKLLDETYRNTLAVVLVARVLEPDSVAAGKPYDLEYCGLTVDVCSAIQTQEQEEPHFNTCGNQAAVCVYALAKSAAEPSDISQWDFYVLKSSVAADMFGDQTDIPLSFVAHAAVYVTGSGRKIVGLHDRNRCVKPDNTAAVFIAELPLRPE